MTKAGKKKVEDPLQDIQDAINRNMYRQQTPHMKFICKHDLDQVWADHPLSNIFPKYESKEWESIRKRYIRVLSILILIDWPELSSRFRPVFLREEGRDDENLPFTDLNFLGKSHQVFSDYQPAFTPVIIEEHSRKHIQEIPIDHRLPFQNEPEGVRVGGYGSVTEIIIASRCLKNTEDNTDNPEPKRVACKKYINENPLLDFRREVRNLDYIKESITDCKRVMKHIAAIVHGNEFMILLPHANLYDLEIFLRGGFEPDPSTDDQRMIYDFDTTFPLLGTFAKLQNAVFEEAHQLASALKWLHEDLKVFGSSDRYLAHMDLKPANILLVEDPRSPAGKWMLSDFGVSSFDKATNARAFDTPSIRDVGHRLTSAGFQDKIVRGHGPYQPPEVDLENVDSRKCDVWSFGCVLCDILAFAIGRTEAVRRFRDSRYIGGDDYFYRKTTREGARSTGTDDSIIELKPQIVQWWEGLDDKPSSPRWVTNYIRILCEALKPKPSDRPDIAAIVRGLNGLAPSIALAPETPQHAPNMPERPTLPMTGESSLEIRTASASMRTFIERSEILISLPKKDKVRAVAVSPSRLQAAFLCKNSVHLYLIDSGDGGETIMRQVDLSPKVDWKKIRLVSRYFAVYGLGGSNEKHVEVYDSKTRSLEATIASNVGMAQDILLSEQNVFAYVYGRDVKLYFARVKKESTVPIRGDDAFIIQAKFSARGNFLCVWATGTTADHAYFVRVNEELASASVYGEGIYQKYISNSSTYEIWPFPDSPVCVVHEAHGGTFLAQPLVQKQAQPRQSIEMSRALIACVVREDLLVCLVSRTIHSGRMLFGYALSQQVGGLFCIAGQGQCLGTTSKYIEKSTAAAAHVVDDKSELVLCTTSGKVLRYVET